MLAPVLNAQVILVRWVNYHLKNAGSARRIKNFITDIADSEAYIVLMSQIAPKELKVDTRALAKVKAMLI